MDVSPMLDPSYHPLMPNPPIQALIFDLDGTLVDTFPLIVDAWNAAVTPITGRTYSPDEVIAHFGQPEPIMFRDALGKCSDQALEIYYRHYEQHHNQVIAFDGVNDMLARLRQLNIPMALVTGKSRRSAEITLRKMNWLDCFQSIITGSEMQNQKPHPEGLLLAARNLNVDPTHCAMVGDSPADIGAAQAAHMTTIVAAWHDVYLEQVKTMNPDHWASAPADVAKLLEK